ncbi:hypothetical protein [Methylopila sp. 73B]|uniref:hypothetical protein n=1 Tax=Methylopila sp. 73B TaxID=1120792 RepID=UPI000370A644|nr:hypothetical protein [Methylopila sp. 73B]
MADVIPFPARPRLVYARPAHAGSRGSVEKWQEPGGAWVVDHTSSSGDSHGVLARFNAEFDADRFIREWNRKHGGDGPKGAA